MKLSNLSIRQKSKTKKGLKTKKSIAKVSKGKLTKQVSNITILMAAAWIFGCLIFISGGIFWYTKVYDNPSKVFWDMIDNNLSTSSISRKVQQNSGGNNSIENTQIVFGYTTGVIVNNDVTQDDSSGSGKSRVIVQGIGTPTDDYQRYTLIDRPALNGKKQDYSKIYGVWVHANANEGVKATQDPQLLSQKLYGAVMFGNLKVKTRIDMVNYIRDHNLYQIDFSKATKSKVVGKNVYSFSANVKLKELAKALKVYGSSIGAKGADTIQPENYTDTDSLDVVMVVNIKSRELVSMTYTKSNIKEEYYNYGVKKTLAIPEHTIDLKTFEDELTKLDGQQ